jgi:hypothetical protein
MAQFVVAKSIAFTFPDSAIGWDIERAALPGCRVVDDGLEISQGSGVYEVTLELPHTTTVDAFVSVDGTILKEYDHVGTQAGTGPQVSVVKHVTKIRAGSVVSVWVKNNVEGVFRGAVLTIRKLPDQL